MLILAREENEAILFNLPDGSTIMLRVLKVSTGGTVKIGIDAPLSVNIVREEIKDKPYERRV